MNFARAVFAFALLMLVLGIAGSRYLVASLFPHPQPQASNLVAAAAKKTSTPLPATAAPAPTVTAAQPLAAPKANASRPRPILTRRPTRAQTSVRSTTVSRRPLLAKQSTLSRPVNDQPVARPSLQRALPLRRPLHAYAVRPVALQRYWVGSVQAARGRLVSVGYVIDNPTGHPMRVMLGASIKSSRAYSWAGSTLSDPTHDVVAILPPGVSTHMRYFAVPPAARPGTYDVAWGLRNARTGRRAGLVTAPAVLHVKR